MLIYTIRTSPANNLTSRLIQRFLKKPRTCKKLWVLDGHDNSLFQEALGCVKPSYVFPPALATQTMNRYTIRGWTC